MKDLEKRIRELADAGEGFNDIFCQACGWLISEARTNRSKTCTVGEVKDLFDLLFEVKQGEYKRKPRKRQLPGNPSNK